MKDQFDIEKVARKYAYSRFPLASKRENEKLIKDWVNKLDTTRKIVEDFRLRITDPRGLKILDAGSGNGGTAIAFAEAGAEVFGVEVSFELVEISGLFAKNHSVNPSYILYDGNKLPFNNNSFDAVLSVSVLEHVTDPINYLSEILRVLRPGGWFYLALPNRLWPRETHTLLFGITYFPYKIAEIITKLFKRNPLSENNLHFYTYWNVADMIKKAKSENDKFQLIEEKGSSNSLFKRIVKNIFKILGLPYKAFLPHTQIILKKEG